ncbi:hypothetical protein [Absidia glauca]|uniref:Uncharacterized protein n=1 Tax=Absidia glauca TaxID=4829 RepID=A0A168T5X4_ABSGL|nr:hypothetical protein [Absidia glauca]
MPWFTGQAEWDTGDSGMYKPHGESIQGPALASQLTMRVYCLGYRLVGHFGWCFRQLAAKSRRTMDLGYDSGGARYS